MTALGYSTVVATICITFWTGVVVALNTPGCARPSPVGPTADSIYLMLVDAGCLAADPSGQGPAFVLAEHNLPDQAPWMACLFDGGTINSCRVPCE
jgi:hypothetical protein